MHVKLLIGAFLSVLAIGCGSGDSNTPLNTDDENNTGTTTTTGTNAGSNEDGQSVSNRLITGQSATDTSTRWNCSYTFEGVAKEYYFWADGTGQQIDEFDDLTPYSWVVNDSNNSLTATTSLGIAQLNNIEFTDDNFFTARDATQGADSAISCQRETIDNESSTVDTNTFASRIITEGQTYSWTCTSPETGEHIYTFNNDGTGTDFDTADSSNTPIIYTISEPLIRAVVDNPSNNTLASFLWFNVVFDDDGTSFTAINGLSFGDDIDLVSCVQSE